MRSATEEFILSPSSPEKDAIRVRSRSLWSTFVEQFISMRCTDSFLGGSSFFIGIGAILLQTISFSTDNWLRTIEPRETLLFDEERQENKTETFQFDSGYWRVCWQHYMDKERNKSMIPAADLEFIQTDDFFKLHCMNYLHTDSNGEEILGISRATGAILNRVLLSAMLHLVSLVLTTVALMLAVLGRLKHDLRTFYSAILYIISGILMSVAVMQYVCVVDDEMSSKMKKTPEGDESQYKFFYMWSFAAASISFICIETCALIELLLYLRRYPSLEDKMNIVPGLQEKVQRAVLNHEFDDIVPQRPGSRRNSPRISVSFCPDNG